jgi:acyl-coenzyme A thioesterase PaaI-like protein
MADASYPPPHHVLSDLGLQIDRTGGELAVRLPVTPYLLDAAGTLRAGVLGVVFDVFAGNLAVDSARPDWALTSELSLHALRPIEKGTLVVTGRALRAGRTQLVIETEARCDASGAALCALGHIGFTRVERRADTPESPVDPPDVYTFGDAGASLDVPLLEALGVRPATGPDAAPGRLELPLSDYVRNSVGGLQGGAVVSLADAAATHAAGPGSAARDVAVRFLALGREGPIRTEPAVLRRGDGEMLLRVALHDRGQDDRLVSVATATVRSG